MAQRLTEKFIIGQAVEIWFERIDHWIPGVIDRHQHPAVWVRTLDGREWFVTNGARIRLLKQTVADPPTPRRTATEQVEDQAT
ncbi:MAG: hypothetical protein AB8G95_31195 [Anaerolineae bacterium]